MNLSVSSAEKAQGALGVVDSLLCLESVLTSAYI